jgi:hypothetical protein
MASTLESRIGKYVYVYDSLCSLAEQGGVSLRHSAGESLGASQHTKESFMHIAPSAKLASAIEASIRRSRCRSCTASSGKAS